MPGSRSDIPDFEGSEDEAFPPLPPPGSPGGGDGEDEGLFTGDGDVSKMPDVPVAKRKGVKRPQPKLDSQRLTSERGLPALRTLFDDVRFRGKGHEAQDLKLLMQKMENWAHRLYPKLQFEDFVDKVEKLGSKKEVQTCLKRIRLDMPLLHQDFMDQDGGDPAPAELQEFRDPDPDPFSTETDVDAFQRLVQSTPAPLVQSSPAPPSLTEEQRRRMELNRQQALARRLKRQQTGPGSSDSQSVQTSPSGHQSTSGSTSGSSTVPNESPIQDDEAPPTGPEEAPPTELEETPPTELEAPPTSLEETLPTELEAPPTSLEDTPPTELEAPPTSLEETPPTELKALPTEPEAPLTELEEQN
ncbi:TIMELESS-interacting protein [Cololabis saira]|uniref:TIMELESS-interacting protein n=1 Tax=Cololabis saira TaxID=129043 RepID=UPI002AD5679D|nr:TIMELESS-interacting protein [Cololabis saira]